MMPHFLELFFPRPKFSDQDWTDITRSFQQTHFQKNKYLLQEGDVARHYWFMEEGIQALTDVTCWRLDYATFQLFFHRLEPFREAGRNRLVASYFELKRKNVSMIADQAKGRYRRLLSERPELLQQVPLKHLASYLGITDTSLRDGKIINDTVIDLAFLRSQGILGRYEYKRQVSKDNCIIYYRHTT